MTMMMIRERRRRRNKNDQFPSDFLPPTTTFPEFPFRPPMLSLPNQHISGGGNFIINKTNYHFNAMQKKKKSSPQKMRERKAKQQNETWKRQKNNNAEKKNEKERITKGRGKHKRTKMKKITRRKTWKKSQKSSESASRRRLSPARTCSCRLQFYRFADNRPLAEKFLKGLSFNPVRVWLPSRYS